MSAARLLADIVDALAASGASVETIAAAVRAAAKLDDERQADKRAKNAERQRRHRSRNVQSRDVTPVTRDERDTPPLLPSSPTPPNPSTPPPSPPTGARTPAAEDGTGDAPGKVKPRKSKHGRIDYPDQFEMLWDEFPKNPNGSKADAYRSWRELDADDKRDCWQGALRYRVHVDDELERFRASGGRGKPPFIVHLATFVNGRRWEGWNENASQNNLLAENVVDLRREASG